MNALFILDPYPVKAINANILLNLFSYIVSSKVEIPEHCVKSAVNGCCKSVAKPGYPFVTMSIAFKLSDLFVII